MGLLFRPAGSRARSTLDAPHIIGFDPTQVVPSRARFHEVAPPRRNAGIFAMFERDPPCFVAGQAMHRHSAADLILEIDISERLPALRIQKLWVASATCHGGETRRRGSVGSVMLVPLLWSRGLFSDQPEINQRH